MNAQASLQNKTAFITGASSGIGLATAVALAKTGVNLILSARRFEKLIELKENLHKDYPHIQIDCLALDVRDHSKIQQLPIALLEKTDILINNAGLARGFNKLQEGAISDWEEMIDTNIKGLLYMTRLITPYLIKKNSGHIVNIGSIAGRETYLNGNVYCATKHAVHALTEALRLDVCGSGIRVSLISPGIVETEFSIARFRGDTVRAKVPYQGLTPLVAEDIADTILYCLSAPLHVNISEIFLTPTAQANMWLIDRKP